MSIKNILIHIDDSEQVDDRLDVAVGLARTHDAHLAAIYAESSDTRTLWRNIAGIAHRI